MIKAYDKVQDLLSRQGTDAVGSRIKWLIDSANESSALIDRIVSAQEGGTTRLEVSLFFNEHTGKDAIKVFRHWRFEEATRELFKTLKSRFLNNP